MGPSPHQELLARRLNHVEPGKTSGRERRRLNREISANCLEKHRALEGIRYHESQDSRPNNFIHRSPALVKKFTSILTRGVSEGMFRPDIDARLFLASSSLLMSGAFTNHYSMSVLVGFDTRSEEGMGVWREHSADLILASIASK